IQTLKDLWDKGNADSRHREFVDISTSEDPVIQDAWNILGWKFKQEAQELFGDAGVMIRKDMIDDAIGYRSASVTDPWTGVTRWDEESSENIATFLSDITGDKAFAWLKRGETFVHDA